MYVQPTLQTALSERKLIYQTWERVLWNDSPGGLGGGMGRSVRSPLFLESFRWSSRGVTGWTPRQCPCSMKDALVSPGCRPLPTAVLHRAGDFWVFFVETGLFLGHRMEVLILLCCVGGDSETTEQRVNPVSFLIWRHLTAHPSQVHILILWSLAKLCQLISTS